VDRREFIGTVAGGLLAAPLAASAQPTGKVPRIGVLWESTIAPRADAFRQGLLELGFKEGQDIVIETRTAEGRVGGMSALAAELVQRNVDVILTTGTTTTQAAKRATNTIPVIMTFVSDPVEAGFVASLAHPGGNITGLTNLGPELSGKWLELLKQIAPKASRVGVLMNPTTRPHRILMKDMTGAAKTLALELQSVDIRDAKALEGVLAKAKKARFDALIVLLPRASGDEQRRILEFAAMQRTPAIYHWREFVDAGGLAYYGASIQEMYRRAATYVDRILKGAKPADLPVEQPTKFDLVINLKTAKALGLTIPPTLLQRADQVIE
jgi:putative tryptophan/tyrosine transport system substrate-binding protein